MKRRRRCRHCGVLLRPLAGVRMLKHWADCDGPGFPYECPAWRYQKVKPPWAGRVRSS